MSSLLLPIALFSLWGCGVPEAPTEAQPDSPTGAQPYSSDGSVVSGEATGGGSSTSNAATGGQTGAPTIEDRYLPLAVGAWWTYSAVDSAGRTGEVRSDVEALDEVGPERPGVVAYRVRSTLLAGGSTVNWQEDLGLAVVRHRAEFYDDQGNVTSSYLYEPSRLRLDESPNYLVDGLAYIEPHSAIVDGVTPADYDVVWTVEALDEVVTVPAGTFSCLRVRRAQTGYSSSIETHWFARGVGKVRETGPETKELLAYSIP